MRTAQQDPQKPFEIQRTERGRDVRFTVVANTDPASRIAVVTVRLARVTDTGAKRAVVRIKADGVVTHRLAIEAVQSALSRAHSLAEESDSRPEGMVAPFENTEYVRFVTDGYTLVPGVPSAEPKLIPAGYYGHMWHNSAHWDWERGVVVYGIGTIVPGAFHNTRYATPEEFEPYDGNPWNDDKGRTTAHRPLIDLGGNRIEVTA